MDARIGRALMDGHPSACRGPPNPYLLPVPRVPRVSNFPTIDVMGVKLLSCTTRSGRTTASAECRP
jgi:hypothetical protein